ncbi:hypothetical protein G6F68_018175 [Rhizopus microsporus]|nr:hypothetical protein G6F68_018175 [Rhizopus microsporus]
MRPGTARPATQGDQQQHDRARHRTAVADESGGERRGARGCAGDGQGGKRRGCGHIRQPYARVHPRVEKIDDDVGQDHHEGAQHQDAQHDGVVAAHDAVEQHAADARPTEHGLHHDAAA